MVGEDLGDGSVEVEQQELDTVDDSGKSGVHEVRSQAMAINLLSNQLA
jgi:hypothetical protein